MSTLVFIANPFRLSPAQLRSLAGISRDIAQVLFAGFVIAPIATRDVNWLFLTMGLTVSFLLWYSELVIVRKLEV